MKKKWTRPKLIVLVKKNNDEAVLAGCKHGGSESGPYGGYAGCISYLGGCATAAAS